MQMPAVCSPKTLDYTTLSHPHLRNCVVATSPPAATAAAVTQMTTSQDDLKRIAAHRAVELVESGMVLGLGTGSTAIHALERIADLLRSGELTGIVGIPTSKKTEGEARALGIPLTDLESNPSIDLSIDGADEVDPFLNLVKGRGGSLLREKMIEGASKRFVVIVDESKRVDKLGGSNMAVPVEVIPFGWKYTLTRLKKLFDGKAGFDARLRMKGKEIFATDNLNYIIDLFFENGVEGDLDGISDEILRIVGVVEHGMFLGMATEVIIAGKDGVVVKTRGEVDAAAEQRRLMTTRRFRSNEAGFSTTGPGSADSGDDVAGLMGILQDMMQTQQEQTSILHDELQTAHKTVTTTIKKTTAPRRARHGNVFDFRSLQPASFAGTETPLEADRWLVDMANLLKATRIPEENRVEVVKIQLTDIARTWWLVEEKRLNKYPILWDQFSEAFLERFFPKTAKREIEQQFVLLRQDERTVDEYATEFLRLSRFASSMVANEEDRANRFQQGLRLDIQRHLASHDLVTYAQVLTAARRIETVIQKEIRDRQQFKPGKRSFGQISAAAQQSPHRAAQYSRPAAPVSCLTTIAAVCSLCHRFGHTRRECRRANGACLASGFLEHQVYQCPVDRQQQGIRRPVQAAPYRPSAPQQRPATPFQHRSPVGQFQQRPPTGQYPPGALCPSQKVASRGRGGGAPSRGPVRESVGDRGVVFTLTTEHAEVTGDVVAGDEDYYIEQYQELEVDSMQEFED